MKMYKQSNKAIGGKTARVKDKESSEKKTIEKKKQKRKKVI